MRDIIVIGASAGGIEPLSKLVGGLAPGIRAALFVVVHIPSDANSALPQMLTRLGTLPALHPSNGEPLKRGRIYVAPPDRHLVVERARVGVNVGPKENRRRPSIDLLFRTAARSYGARVIGILLSGLSDDGSAGLATISARGGVTIVQDPAEARFAQMSRNAMELIKVDHCVGADAMGPLLMSLVSGGPAPLVTDEQCLRNKSSKQPWITRWNRRDSDVQTVAVSCGKSTMRRYDFNVVSVTRTPLPDSRTLSPIRSKSRCGRRSAG